MRVGFGTAGYVPCAVGCYGSGQRPTLPTLTVETTPVGTKPPPQRPPKFVGSDSELACYTPKLVHGTGFAIIANMRYRVV